LLAQFKMDGDDYSSALVQAYLAVQNEATSAGSIETMLATGSRDMLWSDNVHLV
jgi:hypothetical protein